MLARVEHDFESNNDKSHVNIVAESLLAESLSLIWASVEGIAEKELLGCMAISRARAVLGKSYPSVKYVLQNCCYVGFRPFLLEFCKFTANI